jgi:hypothetical protein
MKAEIIRCAASLRKREDIPSIHARNGWADARSKASLYGAASVPLEISGDVRGGRMRQDQMIGSVLKEKGKTMGYKGRKCGDRWVYCDGDCWKCAQAKDLSARHGKWIKKCNTNYSPFDPSVSEHMYICNQCGCETERETNYCPKCGARMEKGKTMSRYGDSDYDDMFYELDEFLKSHKPSELLKLVQEAVEWWEEENGDC